MDQAQGAVLRISSDRDDRMGAKIKTPKKCHAEFASHKNFQRNYAAGMTGNYLEYSNCFESPQKIPTSIKLPQTILAKIFLPPKIENFNPQKIL